MRFASFLCILLLYSSLHADTDVRMQNTNFTLSQPSYDPKEDRRYMYNYNRFRAYANWSEGDFFFQAIGDLINYFGKDFVASTSFEYIEQLHSDTYWSTQSRFNHYSDGAMKTKLYRLYGGYEDDENRIVIGLQNITMGVGHIWTPSNLFNPKNIYALEPDETFGVMALSYTYYLGDQSQIYGVVSHRKDNSYKYAGGFKTTLASVECSLNAIHSDDTTMIAYTFEGDLGDSGIELRSEGAYIQSSIYTLDGLQKEERFFQGVVGADYAFQAGLNLTVETLYSSKVFTYSDLLVNIDSEISGDLVMSHFYLGTRMSYDFNIVLSTSLRYIESFNEHNSRFFSPNLTYTLNDNNSFSLGALLYGGAEESEFGMWRNTYYLKYVFSY